MKKIAVVTATRAEYGLLRRTIEALRAEACFDVQLIVTGTHLSPAFGETWKQIAEDGLRIDCRIDYLSEDRSAEGIARESGRCAELFADAFARMKPDLLLLLGDRYELLPICSSALILGIPIAHIGGGERTEGALDDSVRNAVTMLSTVHFPNSPEAADAIVRMRGSNLNVFEVGEPGAENILKEVFPTREEMAAHFGLDKARPWVLATLHPETNQSEDYNLRMARAMLEVLRRLKGHDVILTKANADPCGEKMNRLYEAATQFHMYDSLSQKGYLGLMKEAAMVVGNSSSGVIEAPLFGTPVVNIGNRQTGRKMGRCVLPCEASEDAIQAAVNAVHGRFQPDILPGTGHTSELIAKHLKAYFHES